VAYLSGKTLIGWGVIRDAPWHFAGLFPTRDEAQARADDLGEGYLVRYGERSEETDSFVSAEAPDQGRIMAGSIFAAGDPEPGAKGES
jgi:hypothetical protein